MKITLVGAMASGKTTIGKKLSAVLCYPFYDTDQWIESETGMLISQLFAAQGEPFFRAHETKALQHFFSHPSEDMVLSTGGGIIKTPKNRHLLSQHSTVIYLKVSVATQLQRTEGDTTRPLLMTPDKVGVLTRLQTERTLWYQETATVTIDADQASPDELVTTILSCIDL